YRQRHPYTNSAPGGWAWTNLPGGVPDADDTAGALLALKSLAVRNAEGTQAAVAGVKWLLDLQNRDGGIPTFCRGWGKLPFDRSGSDLTAHALRALSRWAGRKTTTWVKELRFEPPRLRRVELSVGEIDRASKRALAYLARQQ